MDFLKYMLSGLLVVSIFLNVSCDKDEEKTKTFTIKGKITDIEDTSPIKDVKVILKNNEKSDTKATFTDDKGEYEITDIEYEKYDVKYEKNGYKTQEDKITFKDDVFTKDIKLAKVKDPVDPTDSFILTGKVIDSKTDSPLSDVKVRVVNSSEGVDKYVKTDSKGIYEINDLKFKEYDATYTKSGYQEEKDKIDFTGLSLGLTKDIKLTLDGVVKDIKITIGGDMSVKENKPIGSLVDYIYISDKIKFYDYSLVSGDGSDDNANFEIDTNYDVLITKKVFNYDTKNSYKIRIKAVSKDGKSSVEEKFVIKILKNPVKGDKIKLLGNKVSDGTKTGTLLPSLVTLDKNGDEVKDIVYTLVSGEGDDDNASFKIEDDTKLIANTDFDYSAKKQYKFRVKAKNSYMEKEEKLIIDVVQYKFTKASTTGIFSKRLKHTSVIFNNKIWVIGGLSMTDKVNYYNDVYSSSDGKAWTQETAAAKKSDGTDAFLGINRRASVVFNNKIWLIGGSHGVTSKKFGKGIWSSGDGITWEKEYDMASGIADHNALVFGGKIWIIGGLMHKSGYSMWFLTSSYSSTDGKNWTEHTDALPDGKIRFGATVFDGKMWVIGGLEYKAGTKGKFTNSVWSSSDGKNWSESPTPPFEPRVDFDIVVHKGEMYILGGKTRDPEPLKDVWKTKDGITWEQVVLSGAYGSGYNYSADSFKGKIWMLGGGSIRDALNEVWYSSE